MADVVIPPERVDGIPVQLRMRGGDAGFNDP
jgi:hypothetical protein